MLEAAGRSLFEHAFFIIKNRAQNDSDGGLGLGREFAAP